MRVRLLCLLLLVSVAFSLPSPAQTSGPKGVATEVLSPAALEEVFPAAVFFAGKSATTQIRNSGGVTAGEDKVTAFALVDASGYSSGVRERYQFYLLTSVAIEIGGKTLAAGAYGGGFVNGEALLMDLGAKKVLQVKATTDAEMKRPRPLQVVTSSVAGEYRLYLGREYVSFRQILQ